MKGSWKGKSEAASLLALSLGVGFLTLKWRKSGRSGCWEGLLLAVVQQSSLLCKEKKYNYDQLPTTSVIITFYNEAWSTLLRTVYSVLETSPDTLLEEVILVDDYSDRDPWNKRSRPFSDRIHEKELAVVCPVIDVIDWNTFEYLGNAGEPQIGGFDWRLVFTWHVVPERERIRMRSPIDVIRQAPYSRNKALANSVRAAEVWMDEFKELYYHRNPQARLEPFGDVTERRQLRAKLQCKDFKWFLNTVYPELHVPEDRPGFFGMLQNKGLKDYCFDYNPPNEHQITGHQVILYHCHGMGQNQFFEYTSQNEIRYNTHQPEGCVAVEAGMDVLIMHLCEGATPEDQKFILQEDGSLFHVQSKKCVQAERKELSDSFVPLLRDCTNSDRQKWFFKEHMIQSMSYVRAKWDEKQFHSENKDSFEY
ncbi:hypothetical protein E2I00_006677 [Balaenoptera physalus]|uniref:Polypeptide N-acetylgalactosaminyltransferase n=1 Tax=Balaenoptera physalus TaxID=9770 RepID=A0A643BS73_BALPH|nr:hypothetical protein E2I00_006677 [Balaenoptera physalus]